MPAWAFPGSGPDEPPHEVGADAVPLSIPGSTAHFTRAQTIDPFSPPDWRPERHPPIPAIVSHGRKPALYACGYCHLPDGSGRPENSNLAGLPAAYIQQQVAAFRDLSRRCATSDPFLPFDLMQKVAAEATPTEVAEAAAYFSRLLLPSKLTVRETDKISLPWAEHYIYALGKQEASEPISGRIIETVKDMGAHELRDPSVGYIAYVPTGSIARGRQLATAGPGGPGTSCFVCHGPDLRGTPVAPPLAGHFATYQFRQLLAFRNGNRADTLAALMRPVVAQMTEDDMVSVAAYAASQAR